MDKLTPDEQRRAIELGLGMLSEYVYSEKFDIFNELEGKDQVLAITGLLSISGGMAAIFKDVRQDKEISDTMQALAAMVYMGLEERITEDGE